MLSKLWGNSSLSFRLPDSNDRHYSLEMGIRLLVLIAFSTYYGEWQCQALLVAPLGLDAEFSDNLCVVVQLLSLVHFFAIPWTGFPVLHSLPEFAQAHVHWVSGAIQPSHPY